ncbi:helix-turn-helix domain-containing protein [Natroniella acetigena]|uniref:helix-turn-helix transcriptional regulator n=1 Tax=Natroniella acetigena TaxID=52004 RepID=UPI00200B2A3B|nr:helix-turn-helix transcriptional regulator [Natroniella acetigena]MCK8826364.1 helix-turn-helix domain-containing protein [Natroniella acetigena]
MERSNKIKAGRTKLGYNQEQMAKALNMGITTYKNKENGITEFTETEINKYLALTEQKFEDVFLDKDIFLQTG